MGEPKRQKHPKVFISYSHDSREHSNKVWEFANKLRSDGIDTILDQYEDSPAEGWPKWMDRQIESSDFVLVICTEKYYRKVIGKVKKDEGLGVKWESTLTYQDIYDSGGENKRYIPVLFSYATEKNIPKPLRGAAHYRVDKKEQYEDLYWRLRGIDRHKKPPLGRLKLEARGQKTDFFAVAGKERESFSTVWSDPKMCQNVIHTRDIVSKLNKKDACSDLCSKKTHVKECQLHTHSIGLAKGSSYCNKYSFEVLYLFEELEKIKKFIPTIKDKDHFLNAIPGLFTAITFFCEKVSEDLSDRFNSEQCKTEENILNRTKDLLKEKIEEPEIKKDIDAFIFDLIEFQKQYSSSDIFKNNEIAKSGWTIFCKIMLLSNRIEKIQNELLGLIQGNSESLWLAIDANRERLKESKFQPPIKIDEIKPITSKAKKFLELWKIYGGRKKINI